MDSETHFSIVFNIYGGSNQILPNATSATQNYYGDEAELEKDDVSKDKEPALSPEATRLFSYINKVEDLRIYLVQIAECTNAVELARVIVKMGEREPKITSEEMVKERFYTARELGFDNINMDLIMGLPEENMDDVRHMM